MKIIFTGTSEFAALILKTILEQTDWSVALAVAEPAKPQGRKNQPVPSPVAQAARELKLNFAAPESIKNISGDIAQIKPDVMIVAAYGQILPPEIINIPKFKTVNIHPSLLPSHRGPSPIQSALAQGLTETGVSLMLIDEQIDHGPVISQEKFLIDEDDTYLTLEPKLAGLGSKMLIRDLPRYVSGDLNPKPQNHSEASFTKLIKKEDGRINWQEMSAEEIYNLWRAYIKWPGIFTFFKNKSSQPIRLKLTQIEICPTSDVGHIGHGPGEIFTDSSKNLYIACLEGVIKITRLQPENSKVFSPVEFLNGYGYVIGQTFS